MADVSRVDSSEDSVRPFKLIQREVAAFATKNLDPAKRELGFKERKEKRDANRRGECGPIAVNCRIGESTSRKFQKFGRCKEVYFCSLDCQRADWSRHKPPCAANYFNADA
jgi:hypothetical protein